MAVTIYTAGATAELLSAEAAEAGAATSTFSVGVDALGGAYGAGIGAAAGVVGGAAGSIASQGAGDVIGTHQGFSFTEVAESAIAGGVGGSLVGTTPLGSEAGAIGNAAARAAIGNALTQGISVSVGLQKNFNWTSVAASAVGGGVSSAVGGALNDAGTFGPSTEGQFGRSLVSAFAGSAATTLAQGGRISVVQVATDAFGQALGQSLAAASTSGGGSSGLGTNSSPYVDPDTGDHIVFGAPASTSGYADFSGIANGANFGDGSMPGVDRSNDVQVAGPGGAPSRNLGPGKTVLDPGSYTEYPSGNRYSVDADHNIVAQLPDVTVVGQRAAPGTGELSSSAMYSQGLGNLRETVSTMPSSANDVAGLEALDAQAGAGSGVYIGADGGLYDTPQPPVVITGNRAELLAQLDAEQAQSDAMGNFFGAQTPADGTSFGQTSYSGSIGQALSFIGNIGVGAAEIAGKGLVNQAVRIGSGLASIPYALFSGVDAGVGVQRGLQDSLNLTE